MKAWYVAVAAYREEAAVVRELQLKGFDAYAPMETVWARHARSRKAVQRPLFARYVFVFMDPDQDTPEVRHTTGVTALLGNNGRPLPVPEEIDQPHVVEQLRGQETLGVFDRTVSRKISFELGQAVRIIGGPFSGFMAETMEARTGERRVRVLYSLFGRASPMTIDVDQLRAA